MASRGQQSVETMPRDRRRDPLALKRYSRFPVLLAATTKSPRPLLNRCRRPVLETPPHPAVAPRPWRAGGRPGNRPASRDSGSGGDCWNDRRVRQNGLRCHFIDTGRESRLLVADATPKPMTTAIRAYRPKKRATTSAALPRCRLPWTAAVTPISAPAPERLGHPHSETQRQHDVGGERHREAGLVGAVSATNGPMIDPWPSDIIRNPATTDPVLAARDVPDDRGRRGTEERPGHPTAMAIRNQAGSGRPPARPTRRPRRRVRITNAGCPSPRRSAAPAAEGQQRLWNGMDVP